MKTVAAFCCLLSALWTVDAEIDVEGIEGGDAWFLCRHKLASRNDKAFCRDPCKTTDVLATVQAGATVQKGRITLVDLGDGAFTVNISRLQLSDAGKYWCAADRTIFTTFTAVYLTVKKGVVTDAAPVTAAPDVSPTWTHAETFSSAIADADTSGPARVSPTSNCTNPGENSSSARTLLFISIWAVSALALLVCAAGYRKCRRVSKPQAQVCSSSSSSSADERVV